MSTSRQLSLITVFTFLFSGLCFGAVITVDAGATGNNDGSSWSDAYQQLQSALAVASSGDEIRVAQGVYKPAGVLGDRQATFQLFNGITVKGGYAGVGAPDPNIRDIDVYETILSGDLNGDDGPDFADNGENSFHVLTGSSTDETAVLDGFTVTAGNANGPSVHSNGGGMYNSFASPAISNCTFDKNFALSMGGGMFNYESCPTINNCAFTENRSDDDGGGIRNYLNSHAIITNCDFIANWAFEDGGGLNNRKNSNAIVTGCSFIGNTSAAGGGMENHVGRATVTGVPIITNCIFIGNTAVTGGGMCNNDANPIVTNCSFVGNTGSGMNNRNNNPTVTNCILWANTAGSFDGSGDPNVMFSDVEGGFPGTGNIDADPIFDDQNGADGIVGTEDDNLRLQIGSPCIDVGDNSAVTHTTDLEGLTRIVDGNCDSISTVDMGVYELVKHDADRNGEVNFKDFCMFALYWRDIACGTCGGADLTCDGDVNADDLNEFTDNWLQTTTL